MLAVSEETGRNTGVNRKKNEHYKHTLAKNRRINGLCSWLWHDYANEVAIKLEEEEIEREKKTIDDDRNQEFWVRKFNVADEIRKKK